MTAKGKSTSTKAATAPVGATEGQSAESPNANAGATKKVNTQADGTKPAETEAVKTTSVTITAKNAAEIFGVFEGIRFTPSPNGGSVVVKKKTITWTWTPNRRIPKDSGVLYSIGQECKEFQKAYPNAKPATGGRKASRKGKSGKITKLEQLDSYTLQDLQALAAVVQEGIRREQEVADIDGLIAAMQSRQAGTVDDLRARRAALRPAPPAGAEEGKTTDAALSSTTEPGEKTDQAALATMAKAMSGTAGDSEATPPSVESVASAVTEGNSKSDDQAGANPDQPEGAADTTA
jgi:hypothetical protein